MVQFEYDGVMKRYNVKVPFTLAGESSIVTIAAISEDNRITLHRELSMKLLQQVLLSWDEHEHMETMRAAREAGEFDDLFDEDDAVACTNPADLEYARWELEHDLAKSIDELEFSTRTHNTMQWLGIRTVGELTEKKASELLKFKSFGRKSLTEVEDKLLGLSLALKQ